MLEDRLKKDFDSVENLDDLISAREERKSAISDDLDSMEDFDTGKLPVDPNVELTWPHPKSRSDEDGKPGINVNLMDTSDERDSGVDWQDSAEEMLEADPDSEEGMGAEEDIDTLEIIEPSDITDISNVEEEPETSVTEEDLQRYGMDGGEPDKHSSGTVSLDTAMDTNSDEADFSIEDKFGGQVNHETAEYDFMLMKEEAEKTKKKPPACSGE